MKFAVVYYAEEYSGTRKGRREGGLGGLKRGEKVGKRGAQVLTVYHHPLTSFCDKVDINTFIMKYIYPPRQKFFFGGGGVAGRVAFDKNHGGK